MKNEASIVYSKINLKRNIANYNFVNMLSLEKKEKLETEVVDHLDKIEKENKIYDLSSINELDKKMFLDEDC